MVDIHSILATHKNREVDATRANSGPVPIASFYAIPEIFYDEILVNYKLSRVEIVVFMAIP